MASAHLNRVALVVDDLEAVARSLKEVFDIDLRVSTVEALGLKAGVGNDGIELVEQIGESRAAQHWRRPIAALCITVPDAEQANARMAAAGFDYVQTATTGGGLKEYFYGAAFHGIPMVLHESSGDLIHDIGEGDRPLEVEWKA